MARILTLAAAGVFAAGLCLAAAFAPANAGPAPDGKAVFKAQCAACHSDAARGGATIGPRLFGVAGRKAGTLPGFAYSAAMKGSNLVWNQDSLKRYLTNPGQVVHGTRMPYAGLHNPAQLNALDAYLVSLH